MRAIVTGAAGFVGKYMLVELSLHGYDVTGVDLVDSISDEDIERTLGWLEPGRKMNPQELDIDYIKCNIVDEAELFSVIEEVRPNSIVHLAAQSSTARSFEDPRSTVEVNFLGSLNLFEAARKSVGSGSTGSLTILSVGSSDEYGAAGEDEIPLVESYPPDPLSPYAVSKAAQTMLARQYSRTFGLRIVSTRSFSHTGPMQSDRFVLPSFAKQCAMVREGLGEPVVSTGNIGVVRDFLDVRDTVRAYRLLLEKGKPGEVYNVCSGSGIKLADALDRLIDLAEIDVEVKVDRALLRPSDIPILVGDNDKLRGATSWERRYSMDDTLGDLLDYWLRKVKNLED